MGQRKVRAGQKNVKLLPKSRAAGTADGADGDWKISRAFGFAQHAAGVSGPYSTLPIFFTAEIRRAESSATNFENSGASR